MTATTITVGERRVGVDAPVFIIAEIGVNHNGDEAACTRLIDAAAVAGADAVKIQIVDADESYVAGSLSHTTFKDRALSAEAIIRLRDHAQEKRIILFATPGDFNSLAILQQSGLPAIKISSGLLTNLPLIKKAAATGLPIIMSSGMADLGDVEAALKAAREAGAKDLAILQCTSIYPTPAEHVHLRVISRLENIFGIPAGYSDHSMGPLACVAATAAGARILEKHITLDRTIPGADHAISALPDQFADMVRQVRIVEEMMGSQDKAPTPEEAEKRSGLHRCLVARRAIKADETLDATAVGLKRPLPGTRGMDANKYEAVLGRRAKHGLALDQPIEEEDLEPLS